MPVFQSTTQYLSLSVSIVDNLLSIISIMIIRLQKRSFNRILGSFVLTLSHGDGRGNTHWCFVFITLHSASNSQQFETRTQIRPGDSILSVWPRVSSVEQRDVCREKIRKIQSKNDARYPEEVSNEWSWIDTQNWVDKNERDIWQQRSKHSAQKWAWALDWDKSSLLMLTC